MKLRQFAILLTMVVVLPTFTGCGLSTVDERLDSVEESIEDRVDAAEDAVENRLESAGNTTDSAPVPENSHANQTQTPLNTTSATLTEEEATAIALEHAGFTADQVNYLHTEYEIDDGIPQYEVEFHQDRYEYDYAINAETGAILSFSKDD